MLVGNGTLEKGYIYIPEPAPAIVDNKADTGFLYFCKSIFISQAGFTRMGVFVFRAIPTKISRKTSRSGMSLTASKI